MGYKLFFLLILIPRLAISQSSLLTPSDILASKAENFRITQRGELDSLKFLIQRLSSLGREDAVVEGIMQGIRFYGRNNMTDEGIIYIEEMIAQYESSVSELPFSTVHEELGRFYLRKGEFLNAQNWHFKSLRIREKYRNDSLLGLSYRRVGILYGSQGKDSVASNYFNLQLQTAERLGDPRRIYSALTNLGVSYRSLDRPRKALEFLQESLTMAKEYSFSERSLSTTYHNLGWAYESLGDYETAESNYREAIVLRQKLKSRLLPDSFNNLGNIFLEQERLDSAKKYLVLAEQNASLIQNRLLLRKIYSNLSTLYYETGFFKRAHDYLFQYDTLNQNIFNETKSRQISELETQYETEKKDVQIQLEQSKTYRLMIILIISLVFIIVISIVYFQRQMALKKLRHKELEIHQQEVNRLIQEQELKSINAMLTGEEKERKRVAEDLHDRVGSMLSAMKLHLNSDDDQVAAILDETVEEVRRISHNLETRVLNRFGLSAALEDLAQKVDSSKKVNFELIHMDIDDRLDHQLELNTYRMVQELVSNALKHSGANEITTQVNRIQDHLLIIVEDNGKGFDSFAARKSDGIGLKGVRSRVNDFGGQFNIDSGKGNGTTVTIEILL